MYKQEIKSITIDITNSEEVKKLDSILNNPLCVVLSDEIQKITTREGDSSGGFTSVDKLIKFITYKEKVLL